MRHIKSSRFVNDQILSLLCCTSHCAVRVEICGPEKIVGQGIGGRQVVDKTNLGFREPQIDWVQPL